MTEVKMKTPSERFFKFVMLTEQEYTDLLGKRKWTLCTVDDTLSREESNQLFDRRRKILDTFTNKYVPSEPLLRTSAEWYEVLPYRYMMAGEIYL